MKIIECEQGGAAWFNARMKRPTASRFCDIVTPKGKARTGDTPRRYMLELLGERLTNIPAEHHETAAMARGTELEPKARAWYELASGLAVRQVGFVTSDCGRWGFSPDGLPDGRGLEIKCPLLPTFLDICESQTLPDDHAAQVQASLWISGLPAWDYVCYTDAPGIIPQIITVLPDAAFHAALSDALPKFCDALDEMEKKMREAGHGVLARVETAEDLPTWEEIIGKVTVG